MVFGNSHTFFFCLWRITTGLLVNWLHALFLFSDSRRGVRRPLNVWDRDNEVLGSGRAEGEGGR